MALINLRNALMAGKRLPYDSEVEYLESTGTQWIDTGIVGVSEWHITAQGTATPSASNCVIATKSSGGSFWGAFRGYNYWAVGSANDSTNYRITLPYTSLGAFVVNFNSNSVTFTDGVETATRNSTPNFSKSFYLFSTHNDGYAAKVKIFGCKVYQNSILVRDYIPVRKDTVGYLYDRVSDKLFGNAGTGDFVLGQDVVPVEYLQSSGTQYIDTGVVGYKTTKVESHCALLNANSAYPAMWGARTGSRNNDFQIYYNTPTIWGNPSSIVLRTGNSDKSISTSDIGVNTFIGTRLDIVAADGALSVNGYNFSTPAFSNFTTPHSILMFCEYTANTPKNFGSFVYWGMKMWQADSIVRSFLPVRVGTGSTWEGAMMDTITRRIYRNQGTGAFAYGNDLKYPIPAE